jgi:hypothetical protein
MIDPWEAQTVPALKLGKASAAAAPANASPASGVASYPNRLRGWRSTIAPPENWTEDHIRLLQRGLDALPRDSAALLLPIPQRANVLPFWAFARSWANALAEDPDRCLVVLPVDGSGKAVFDPATFDRFVKILPDGIREALMIGLVLTGVHPCEPLPAPAVDPDTQPAV